MSVGFGNLGHMTAPVSFLGFPFASSSSSSSSEISTILDFLDPLDFLFSASSSAFLDDFLSPLDFDLDDDLVDAPCSSCPPENVSNIGHCEVRFLLRQGVRRLRLQRSPTQLVRRKPPTLSFLGLRRLFCFDDDL